MSGAPPPQLSALTIAWSNERWHQLSLGRTFGDVLDPYMQTTLQSWIEDEEADSEDDDPTVFALQLRDPTSTLFLSKTMLTSTPNSFCIVTSQIPSPDKTFSNRSEVSSPGFRSNASSDLRGSFSTYRASTSSDRTASLSATDFSTSRNASMSEGYFPSSDRSFNTRSRVKLRSSKEPQLSVQHMLSAADEFWHLLESFDWNKTALGPRERWVEAIGPLLSITFQSKTMDCLWLGEDLQLV